MSDRRRRTGRDRRRRELGQNFLVDEPTISRFLAGLDITPGELVVDIGAGSGALSFPLADLGAHVWAVETDHRYTEQLRSRARRRDDGDAVRVIGTDLRRLRLPTTPFRIVANPPFALTTTLLELLLDRPERGPNRVDLIVQRDVARKRSTVPPATLRSAAWAPWWEFRLGETISRSAFRPVPSVDAAVLTIVRRKPPILPERLAPSMREVLREVW